MDLKHTQKSDYHFDQDLMILENECGGRTSFGE